jgi:hypothetical protein
MTCYLDDILGNTNTESDTQLQSTIAIIYQPAQLKFTKSEKFCNYTVYLDIQLSSPQSRIILEFGFFCKPGTNFQYSLFNSFIPRHIPTRLVISRFIHIYNHNSHWNNFLVAWNRYVNILQDRGYPKTWVIKILRIHINKLWRKQYMVDHHLIFNHHPSINIPAAH